MKDGYSYSEVLDMDLVELYECFNSIFHRNELESAIDLFEEARNKILNEKGAVNTQLRINELLDC